MWNIVMFLANAIDVAKVNKNGFNILLLNLSVR